MIQLRVTLDGEQYWLDLNENDPIKITLSMEDIENTNATSAYSKAFTVPNTPNNYKFFKTAFELDGVDYDVTVKKEAELLIDGQSFKKGTIRLQKILKNRETNKIDYQIIFLGETRSFASALSEETMCSLDLDLTHILDYQNVITSWNAYPEGTSLTSGLLNGDVIYPLIDFGNTYVDGVAQEPRISAEGANRFTQNSHPLVAERFKPMIRAKALIDSIFEKSGFTYKSEFLNSSMFHKIYISAFGNTANVNADTSQSKNLCNISNFLTFQSLSAGDNLVELDYEILDIGDNFDPITHIYTAPLTGRYTFVCNVGLALTGSGTYAIPRLARRTSPGGSWIFYNGSAIPGGGFGSVNRELDLNAGDEIALFIFCNPTVTGGTLYNADLQCTGAPGEINPIKLLDCNYKLVDFIKDILSTFRLVLAPSVTVENEFIIEPWSDYIAKGNIIDWSNKLDRSKDLIIEPLFLTQKDSMHFKFTTDGDYLNENTVKSYKQVYGELRFNSQSELLKDTRTIQTSMSPTPTIQIEGEPSDSTWVIPQVHLHEAEGPVTQHMPIAAKTRILFYNGKKNSTLDWYFDDGENVQQFSYYPSVSYHESWPPQNTDLNLNFAKWFGYYGNAIPGYDALAGSSLYERYWAGYIESIYDKYSRKVTGNFILNNTDITTLSYSDVIFVDGVYYRVNKISDIPIGKRASSKVELIKLNNYIPDYNPTPPGDQYFYDCSITDCDVIFMGNYVVRSSVPLSYGDFINVEENTNCYTVTNISSNPIWDLTWANSNDTCSECVGERGTGETGTGETGTGTESGTGETGTGTETPVDPTDAYILDEWVKESSTLIWEPDSNGGIGTPRILARILQTAEPARHWNLYYNYFKDLSYTPSKVELTVTLISMGDNAPMPQYPVIGQSRVGDNYPQTIIQDIEPDYVTGWPNEITPMGTKFNVVVGWLNPTINNISEIVSNADYQAIVLNDEAQIVSRFQTENLNIKMYQ